MSDMPEQDGPPGRERVRIELALSAEEYAMAEERARLEEYPSVAAFLEEEVSALLAHLSQRPDDDDMPL